MERGPLPSPVACCRPLISLSLISNRVDIVLKFPESDFLALIFCISFMNIASSSSSIISLWSATSSACSWFSFFLSSKYSNTLFTLRYLATLIMSSMSSFSLTSLSNDSVSMARIMGPTYSTFGGSRRIVISLRAGLSVIAAAYISYILDPLSLHTTEDVQTNILRPQRTSTTFSSGSIILARSARSQWSGAAADSPKADPNPADSALLDNDNAPQPLPTITPHRLRQPPTPPPYPGAQNTSSCDAACIDDDMLLHR
mmetsp:Transcript_4724/g.7118  ORF Transcript_4724/g.7118 Transcript_4724/m.7118 type:complete len:257 (-) Transcript_4724:1203-1973(-)